MTPTERDDRVTAWAFPIAIAINAFNAGMGLWRGELAGAAIGAVVVFGLTVVRALSRRFAAWADANVARSRAEATMAEETTAEVQRQIAAGRIGFEVSVRPVHERPH